MATITNTFPSGTTLTLEVDIDALSTPLDELQFIRDLIKRIEDFTGPAPTRTAAAPAAPRAKPGPKPREPKPSPAYVERKRSVGRPAGGSHYDFAKVAAIANTAIEAGKPMGVAIADEFGVKPAMASWLVVEARKRGHHIAKRSQGGRKPKPVSNVTPLVKPNTPAVSTDTHPAAHAFTPADTLKLLEKN